MLKDRIGEAPNPRRAISLKLAVVIRQMHKRFDQRVGDIGVTRSQWTLIAVIARHPGTTQREIAEILEMSEASAGRLIDRLCSEGLLERKPKTDDRRAYCIHLTDRAQAVVEQLSCIAGAYELETFAGFDAEELARLEAYLDRLAANVAVPL
jgi:MarR family transcriptional regulator, transcriptional regulator for hemolysin